MSILVVLEQQGGQWHRMSWETLAAGQQLARRSGSRWKRRWSGKGIGALANEAATKKLAKVWAVEHDLLEAYTADGYTAAVEAADPENAAHAWCCSRTPIRCATSRPSWRRDFRRC